MKISIFTLIRKRVSWGLIWDFFKLFGVKSVSLNVALIKLPNYYELIRKLYGYEALKSMVESVFNNISEEDFKKVVKYVKENINRYVTNRVLKKLGIYECGHVKTKLYKYLMKGFPYANNILLKHFATEEDYKNIRELLGIEDLKPYSRDLLIKVLTKWRV